MAELLDALVLFGLGLSAAIAGLLILRIGLGDRMPAAWGYGLWMCAPATGFVALLAPLLWAGAEVAPAVSPAGIDASVSALLPEAQPAVVAETAPQALAAAAAQPAVWLWIWMLGAAGWFSLAGARQLTFERRAAPLTQEDGGYYRASDRTSGPALVGVLRPKIIVPSDFDQRYGPEERALILAHERGHLQASDRFVNAAIALVQGVYWFNPLVHLAARGVRQDQETRCDARVLARHPKNRPAYARLLVKQQAHAIGYRDGVLWPSMFGGLLQARLRRIASGARQSGPGRTWLAVVIAVGLSGALGAGLLVGAADPIGRLEQAAAGLAAPQDRALLNAAANGDLDAVAHWLAVGADPNVNLPPSGSPLVAAAQNGHIAVIDLLIARGADANLSVRGRGFPLYVAAQGGHLPSVERLLEAGALPNARVAEGDSSPLSIASQQGHVAVMLRLLDRGADPNLVIEDEGTALIAAITAGQAEAADMLVRHGADLLLDAPVERRRADGGPPEMEMTNAAFEAGRLGRGHLIYAPGMRAGPS